MAGVAWIAHDDAANPQGIQLWPVNWGNIMANRPFKAMAQSKAGVASGHQPPVVMTAPHGIHHAGCELQPCGNAAVAVEKNTCPEVSG